MNSKQKGTLKDIFKKQQTAQNSLMDFYRIFRGNNIRLFPIFFPIGQNSSEIISELCKS